MHEGETQQFFVKHSVWTRDYKYVCVCLHMHKHVWEREKEKIFLYCGEMQKYQPRVMANMQQHAFSCSKLTLFTQNGSMHWGHNISRKILFKTFKIGWLINQMTLPTKSKGLVWIWHIYLSSKLSSPKKRMTPKYYANSIFFP